MSGLADKITVLSFLHLETSYNKTCLEAIINSSFDGSLDFVNSSARKNTIVLQKV